MFLPWNENCHSKLTLYELSDEATVWSNIFRFVQIISFLDLNNQIKIDFTTDKKLKWMIFSGSYGEEKFQSIFLSLFKTFFA